MPSRVPFPRIILFSFDLKSGYHHVDVFPDHRKYLAFSWDFGVGPRYFQFTVLPFGLSSAPVRNCSVIIELN